MSEGERQRLAGLFFPVLIGVIALPRALYFGISYLLEFLADVFNSGLLNNLHYHLYSNGAVAMVFWGCIMLGAAGLLALLFKIEGVLEIVSFPGRMDRRMLEIAVLFAILYIIGSMLYAYLLHVLGDVATAKEDYPDVYVDGMHMPVLFSQVFAAPFAEEFLYRGALMGVLLARGWRPLFAIVFSSLLFTVIHIQYEIAGLLIVFLGGCGFGFLRVYSGGLAAPILTHVLINLIITQLAFMTGAVS